MQALPKRAEHKSPTPEYDMNDEAQDTVFYQQRISPAEDGEMHV